MQSRTQAVLIQTKLRRTFEFAIFGLARCESSPAIFLCGARLCARVTGGFPETNDGAGRALAREADELEFERAVKVQARTADDLDAIASD